MQKVSDARIAEIFAKYEEDVDRNETLSADDVEIILPTAEEKRLAEEEAKNPEYDIYDVEEDWDG